jgi:hypothetical protein
MVTPFFFQGCKSLGFAVPKIIPLKTPPPVFW